MDPTAENIQAAEERLLPDGTDLSTATIRALHNPVTTAECLVLAEELLFSVRSRIQRAEKLSDVKAIADEVDAAAEFVSRVRQERAPDSEKELERAARLRRMKDSLERG